MSGNRYDIRILKSCVDPNPLMVERQDPDSFTRFQTRERYALEIATYVFKRPIKKKTKIGFQYRLSLNAGQKYCRMLQGGHSAILSTFIKLPFSIKTFVLTNFKWPL